MRFRSDPSSLRGSIAPVVTPFTPDGELDTEGLRRLIALRDRNKSDARVVAAKLAFEDCRGRKGITLERMKAIGSRTSRLGRCGHQEAKQHGGCKDHPHEVAIHVVD